MSTFEPIRRAGTLLWDAVRESLLSQLPSASTTLYHYTDAHGLLGIAGQPLMPPELWATHHAFLNDPEEGTRFRTVLEEVGRQVVRSLDLNTENGRKLAHLAGNLSGTARYTFGTTWYVLSLTEHDDHLGQWRMYGADGAGYSVGMKPGALESVSAPADYSATLLPVVYDPEQQKQLARALTEGILHSFPGVLQQVPELSSEPGASDRHRYAAMYAASLAEEYLAACFKAPAYESEREWRLVVRGLDPGAVRRDLPVTADLQVSLEAVKFRVRRGRIVPYVAVHASTLEDLMAEVVAGPCQVKDEAEVIVNGLLAGRGALGPGRCAVRQSRHAYRGS